MGCEVYANGDEIACKAGDGKVIAAFPDVCLTPPPPPAGPIPVPYPDTSFSKDMQSGSKTVKIKDDEVMLKDSSFYKTSPLGDEAATNGQGAGVVTHVITGKTYFVAWSMDVQFEGANVDRHTDMTTSNHASPPANESVPMINAAMMAPPVQLSLLCECCNLEPPHSAAQALGESISEEEYYSPPGAPFAADAKELLHLIRTHEPKTPGGPGKCAHLVPPHPPGNDPCAKYYKTKPPESKAARARFSQAGASPISNPAGSLPHIHGKGKISHRVPLGAGGCPIGKGNTAPEGSDPDCKAADAMLTKIHDDATKFMRAAR